MAGRQSKAAEIEAGEQPVVVVIGDFAHEGLTAKVEGLGYAVINRRLRSKPNNWLRIIEQLQRLDSAGRLRRVFAYFPSPTLLYLADAIFDEVRPILLAELVRTHAIVFVYETNLYGEVDPFPWELDDTDYGDSRLDPAFRSRFRLGRSREDWLEDNEAAIGRALEFLDECAKRGLEVVPFRKRNDVTIRVFEALEDADAGVFLRLYVPHGRYQSDQFEEFVSLFSRYLREVEATEISVDVQRTRRGTTYVFKGTASMLGLEELKSASTRFDAFLQTAASTPRAAEAELIARGASPSDAAFLVAKYVRATKRLLMESKHEFQRRHLILQQGMEADLLAASEGALLPVPPDDSPSALLSIIGNTAPVTIQVGSGTHSAQSILAMRDVIEGGVSYSEEDRAILALIELLHDEFEVLRLKSELDRLKDPETSKETKRTAVQKLKTFLYGSGRYVARKADEVGTKLLISYLDRYITTSNP